MTDLTTRYLGLERANYVKTLHSWSTPPRLTPSRPAAGRDHLGPFRRA